MALMINYHNSFFKSRSKIEFARKAVEISEDVIYQNDPHSNAQWVGEEIN